MSQKLQITISDRIYAILKKRAKKGDKHILTYAGMLLSEKLDEEGFNDGFG